MKSAFSGHVVTFLSLRAGVECFPVQGWNISSTTTKAESTRCEFVNIRRVPLLTICPLLLQATVNLKLYFLYFSLYFRDSAVASVDMSSWPPSNTFSGARWALLLLLLLLRMPQMDTLRLLTLLMMMMMMMMMMMRMPQMNTICHQLMLLPH